jgi:hypothetical protein
MNRRGMIKWIGVAAAAGLSGCTESGRSPTTESTRTPEGTPTESAKASTGTPRRFDVSKLTDAECSQVHRPPADYPTLPAEDPRAFALTFERTFARGTVGARPEVVSTPGFDGTNAEVVESGTGTATVSPPGTLVSTTVRLDYAKEGDTPQRTVLASENVHAWYAITDRVVARASRDPDTETPPEEGWRLLGCADTP